MIKTQVVKLKVNKTMQRHLDALCDYRRYCWNNGLETWQLMYELHTLNKKDNPRPNERRVRDELVNFFDKAQPDWGIPSFKSKKAPRQGFKTDRAKIVNGKLRLDRPRSISKDSWHDLSSYEVLKMSEVKVISIFKEKDSYYAALPYEEEISSKAKTYQKTAVDVNVGHLNYTDGKINVLPAKLQKLYKRIKHYQRILARKREANGKLATKSNNYFAARTKL